MIPQTHQRKKKNSSKVNLTTSFIFHGLLVGALLYFAAHEGLLGKKIQKIAVQMVKDKPPEKPKEPEKPKMEPPKETPKFEPKVAEEPKTQPVMAPPVVAPANNDAPSFQFSDGAHAVNSESDPVQLYKGYMEYSLRSRWNRPENMDDATWVAEVQVSVDKAGYLSNVVWKKGSGNDKWDQSVKEVFKAVQNINRHPPTNFPPQIVIRFDVEEETQPVMAQ